MENTLINSVVTCNRVIDLYRDLLNSYVTDYYIENLWSAKLSQSWRGFLEVLPLNELGPLLDYTDHPSHLIQPLTILCVKKILQTFSLNRTQKFVPRLECHNLNFYTYFWKNVKLKKRHEIETMAKLTFETAMKTGCFNVVDIGSGLGHLSRLLTYRYGFRICTFEAQGAFTELATKLDGDFERILENKKIPHKKKVQPVHVHMKIEDTLSEEDFQALVRKSFANYDNDFKFGIIGLHTCGNLGSSLLRLYNNSSSAAFVNLVSCCYMKLSLEPSSYCGFPLSAFYNNQDYKLDYLSCETACHAIENFIKKISTKENYLFKIHSFRAGLESLLTKLGKDYHKCPVGNVSYEQGLSFKNYCLKATAKNNIIFKKEDIQSLSDLVESTWTRVVKFYSVRLLFAPIIESVILYDRLLFLKENGHDCDIVAAFNPEISPRNHVIMARKS